MASPMSFANIYYKQTVDINALYVNINKYFIFVMHVNTSLHYELKLGKKV